MTGIQGRQGTGGQGRQGYRRDREDMWREDIRQGRQLEYRGQLADRRRIQGILGRLRQTGVTGATWETKETGGHGNMGGRGIGEKGICYTKNEINDFKGIEQ